MQAGLVENSPPRDDVVRRGGVEERARLALGEHQRGAHLAGQRGTRDGVGLEPERSSGVASRTSPDRRPRGPPWSGCRQCGAIHALRELSLRRHPLCWCRTGEPIAGLSIARSARDVTSAAAARTGARARRSRATATPLGRRALGDRRRRAPRRRRRRRARARASAVSPSSAGHHSSIRSVTSRPLDLRASCTSRTTSRAMPARRSVGGDLEVERDGLAAVGGDGPALRGVSVTSDVVRLDDDVLRPSPSTASGRGPQRARPARRRRPR